MRNESGLLPRTRERNEPTVDLGILGTVAVADAVAQTFGAPLTSRGVPDKDGSVGALRLQLKARSALIMRPAERSVHDAFVNGDSIEDIAAWRGTAHGTVAGQLINALNSRRFEDVPPAVWTRLIPRCLQRVVQRMHDDADEALDGLLAACQQRVSQLLSGEPEWEALETRDQWVAIRVARLYVARRTLHKRGECVLLGRVRVVGETTV